MERSSLLVSRAAKPWQGRTLEGSSGSGARFWSRAVLRGSVVTFGLEGREAVVGVAARAFGPAVMRERVVTFGLEACETVAGACTLEGSSGSGARFCTPAVLRGKVVILGLEGRETVAEESSRRLWR